MSEVRPCVCSTAQTDLRTYRNSANNSSFCYFSPALSLLFCLLMRGSRSASRWARTVFNLFVDKHCFGAKCSYFCSNINVCIFPAMSANCNYVSMLAQAEYKDDCHNIDASVRRLCLCFAWWLPSVWFWIACHRLVLCFTYTSWSAFQTMTVS